MPRSKAPYPRVRSKPERARADVLRPPSGVFPREITCLGCDRRLPVPRPSSSIVARLVWFCECGRQVEARRTPPVSHCCNAIRNSAVQVKWDPTACLSAMISGFSSALCPCCAKLLESMPGLEVAAGWVTP